MLKVVEILGVIVRKPPRNTPPRIHLTGKQLMDDGVIVTGPACGQSPWLGFQFRPTKFSQVKKRADTNRAKLTDSLDQVTCKHCRKRFARK